jgi:hypothetical protein
MVGTCLGCFIYEMVFVGKPFKNWSGFRMVGSFENQTEKSLVFQWSLVLRVIYLNYHCECIN